METRSHVGRPGTVDMRSVWEAIQYISSTGFRWRLLPKDFPAISTVRYYFYKMRDDGTFIIIKELLSVANRLVSGREAEPTAAVIDSQSVKSTESGGVSGYDASKKIKGRKRHITVDTQEICYPRESTAPAYKISMRHLAGNCGANVEKGASNVIADPIQWKVTRAPFSPPFFDRVCPN